MKQTFCTLKIVLFVVLAAVQPLMSIADERQPITWDQVYGRDRLNLSGNARLGITWVSDESWVTRESSGWMVTNAKTGESQPWFSKEALATSLVTDGLVTQDEANSMAEGGWKFIKHSDRQAVFEHQNCLIRIRLDGTEKSIVRNLPEPRELEKLSPRGDSVAMIHKNDIWVADFSDGSVRQLTQGGTELIRNGKADWVYFEEVYNRRWDAYQWSPDGSKIVYQQFDDTQVPVFYVNDDTEVQQTVEIERFPKAGDTNPTVRLGVVPVSGGTTQWVDTSAWVSDDLIVSGFQWTPDSMSLFWYAQNRIQTTLDVVRTDLSSGQSTLLVKDRTEAWVDNPGDVTFLKDGSFLLFSERTGWKHLYRVSADGTQMEPLTSGEWEVRSLIGVNENDGVAFVSGTRESHIAESIYSVGLDSSKPSIRLLTEGGGQHAADASPGLKLIIDTYSSLNQPPGVVLRDSDGKVLRTLREPMKVPSEKFRFGQVELIDVPMADQTTTKAVIVRPPDFDPMTRYPVWLMTYGGPHHPGVKDAWSGRLLEHLLANLGIVVIRFDPRSASGYGAKSAWIAYKKLGVEETKDLVSLCNWLEQQTWVDGGRIGMNGHSYGGYYTAYAMTHCNKLCAGIAGAPVTDWSNYDTIYTERFMSTPQENPEGYKVSSVTKSARDLHGRLLILHGLKDDNVHPANSFQLIHQLQRANKEFEVMLYPTARHGIFGSHYERLMFNFIVESMGKPEAAKH